MLDSGLFRQRTPEERARACKASDLAMKWRLRVWQKAFLSNLLYVYASNLRDRLNGAICSISNLFENLGAKIGRLHIPEICGAEKKRLTTRSYQFGRKLMEKYPPTDFDPNGPSTSIGGEILESNYLGRTFKEALETKVSYDKKCD